MDDFDFKSLYPSEALQHNIGPNTQIGMIKIDQVVHDRENIFNNERFSRGGVFLEDYHSGNIIEFCKRWLHFAGYIDMMRDIEEYFTFIRQIQSDTSCLFGNQVRPIVIEQPLKHNKEMVNTIREENHIPKLMVNIMYKELSREVYNRNFERGIF